MTDLTGDLFGTYRLIRQIGRGGFADVYLGTHIYLQTQAAIKILQVQFAQDALASFLSEARTLIQLEHPHIVRVLECSVEKNMPFLVMSYAPGGSLRQQHSRGLRVPPRQVSQYINQVASALQYAHERKLIHRDIKPENILLSQNNTLLLSDFGLVLTVQTTNSHTLNEMAGTVPYMSPEQLQGKPQAASDQYALGIVTYEWLSGHRPFQGSFVEVASQHVLSLPPPLYGRVPGLSREIEQVVFTALAKNPQERFPSVQAFALALTEAISVVPEASQASAPELPGLAPSITPASVLSSPSTILSSEQNVSGVISTQTPLTTSPGTPASLLNSQQDIHPTSSAHNRSIFLLPIDKQPTALISAVSQSQIQTSIKERLSTPVAPGNEVQAAGNLPLSAGPILNQARGPLPLPDSRQAERKRKPIVIIVALLALVGILLFALVPMFLSQSFSTGDKGRKGSLSTAATTPQELTGGTPTIASSAQPANHLTPGSTSTSTSTATVTTTSTPVNTGLTVTGVSASVSPTSYQGSCSNPLALTFTGTIRAAPGSSGGTVSYTWLRSDNVTGPVQTVTFKPGDTAHTVTTSWQGPTSNGTTTLWETLKTISPNTKTSSQALIQITCVPNPLTVTGINVSGTEDLTNCIIAFSLTAVISISANAPAGSLTYTWILSDGTTVGPSTISIAASQQQATINYRWETTGPIRPTYSAMLRVTSPNAIDSNQPVFTTMHC
ncbi:MAG TPA: serine/threonine-protein kinase [Ktedonobacteraceae bacterium]|nr:serine/threonine-protein kinase [Ktedonobacteraceae bacterium]